jgi:membrane-associated phospholipid phosphatase
MCFPNDIKLWQSNKTVMRDLNNLGGFPSTKVNRRCWTLALLLMACGLYLHGSLLNRQWLIWGHRNSWLPDQFWLFVTQWGDAAQALLLLLVVFRLHPVKVAWVLKTWLMGTVASPLLKAAWDAPRPLSVLDLQWLHAIGLPPMGGHSMPSGHSLAAGSMAALLFFALDRGRVVQCVMVVLGGLIGLSRLAVGAHWPADVLAGLGLGLLLVLCAHWWEQVQPWAQRLASDRAQWLLVVLMLVLLYVVWRPPSEGWGMTLARLLLTLGVLVTLTREWYSHRTRQSSAGGVDG